MSYVHTERERSTDRTRLEVRSTAFREGDRIPVRHTADGADFSPPIAWGEPPERTRSFALICEDPDAPSGLFVHWLAWGIKPDQRGLDEGVRAERDTDGIRQGQNSFHNIGYGGPKPPPGKPHRYRFRVYALDNRPELAPGASRKELDRAIEGHVLAEGVLVGTYSAEE
jgi:Raf kinase inhibitor-like YbhB/YbcL family protein